MDYEKIGALIRRLRTQQGLTQRQLAVQLDISDKAVSKWERGHAWPKRWAWRWRGCWPENFQRMNRQEEP